MNDYEMIFDSMRDGMIATDTEGLITRMNPAAQSLTGWDLADALGKALGEVFVTVDDKPPEYPEAQSGKDVGSVSHSILVTKNKERVPVANRVSRIRDGSGQTVGFIQMFWDRTEEHATENALRRSKETAEQYLNIAAEIIVSLDADGTILLLNDNGHRLLGYEGRSLVGKNWFDTCLPARLRKPVKSVFKKLMAGEVESIANYENPVVTKSGEERLFLWHNTLVKDNRGGIVGTLSSGEDITSRVESEQEIQRQKELLERISEASPVGITVVDVKGRITFANRAAETILGLTRDKIKQRDYNDPDWQILDLHGNCIPDDHLPFARVIRTGKPVYNAEHTIEWSNGRRVILSINAVPIVEKTGEISSVVASLNDVTEQQEAVNAYSRIWTMSTDLICVADIDKATFIQVNPAFTDTLGYSEEELLERPFLDFVHPEDVQRTIDVITEKLQAGVNVISFENRYRCKDGSYRVLDWNSHPRPKEGVTFAIAHDITDRKRKEGEMLKMQKLESIGTLAGGIAHDFNNLLTGFFANVSMAKVKLSKEHPAYSYISKAEQSIDRATMLTSQLLTFAKGGEPVKQIVDLTALVEDTVRFDLSGSNVKPVFKFAEDHFACMADKGQLQQVLSNLTINAREAMPEGGCLFVTITEIIVAEGDILNLDSGRYVKMTIRDEGAGIDPKYHNLIFDPYFTTKQTGSGLGLATVYSIIHRHGGTITVSSDLGKGTVFDVYLPSSAQTVVETEAGAIEQQMIRQSTRSLLLMDDEEVVREVTTNMLEDSGLSVVTTCHGREAVCRYREMHEQGKPFDIVILDLTIPGEIGGKEVVREILAINPEATVIVASGYANDPVMANFQEYGFLGVIKKPFTYEQMMKVLAQFLS